LWARPPRGALLLAAGALALVLMAATASPTGAQGSRAERERLNKKNQIKQLQFEKEQVQRRLEKFQASEKEELHRIERLVEETKRIKRRERELERRDAAQRSRKARHERRIRALTAKIEQSRARVAGHLRRLYRLSKTRDSATLVALARYKDFFRDSRYLGLVIQSDHEAIEEFERLKRELARKREEAEQTLVRLAALEKGLAKEKRELESKRADLRKSVAEMRDNRRLYAKYLEELEETRRGMEAALVSLERDAPLAAAATPPQDPARLRGRLPPPSPGRVIAGFGKQDPRYALKKFQRGMVIRVAEAARVSAVAPGRVVHAGPFRGYEQLVVLDHGRGLFTVYGHLEDLRIERGGWVPGGATLGEATYQPIDSAYDIYFEIRMNGKPEDPKDWLRPGSLNGLKRGGADR
jgi:septal ring factor EnvC (AmiA/AmiB activator)